MLLLQEFWAYVLLASFPGAEEGEKSAWYTLFAHAHNYSKGHVVEVGSLVPSPPPQLSLLANTASDDSCGGGLGTRLRSRGVY